jgi:PhoH-like ATPase
MASRKTSSSKRKIFVLDTSVILFDHNSINCFDEHDVVLPITVLEELDEFKKGHDSKNYEAREFIRSLDKLTEGKDFTNWIPLEGENAGSIKVVMDIAHNGIDAEKILGRKMDHRIINAALSVRDQESGRTTVLVTKDINLRLKAKALELESEDYLTGKVKDVASLYKGKQTIEGFNASTLSKLYEKKSIEIDEVIKENPGFEPFPNSFYVLRSDNSSGLAYYNVNNHTLDHVEKRSVYGIKPRNSEQAFAIHAILNPDIKLVTLTGVAGTGKTLIALAASLEQRRDFKQIYLARPIVPLSNRDLGFLPGDAKDKIDPYMQPLWDNLKFIKNQFSDRDKEYRQVEEMVDKEKILITPLAYIRGRSLANIIFIVDECQNLTPHEVKTIITRAGEGAKFIFTGDIRQIDTPYLDEQSNGLSYLVDRVKGHDMYAHVTLEKGERSALANLANDLL